VRLMEMAETAMETNGDGFGGTSPSRQGAGTETFCPPKFVFDGGGAAELFWENADCVVVVNEHMPHGGLSWGQSDTGGSGGGKAR
jgi:hypothetical protein